MVAPNREITNTNLFASTSTMSNPCDINSVLENININAPRGRTIIVSTNFSRDSSVLFKASYMEYHDCIEVQNNNSN